MGFQDLHQLLLEFWKMHHIILKLYLFLYLLNNISAPWQPNIIIIFLSFLIIIIIKIIIII